MIYLWWKNRVLDVIIELHLAFWEKFLKQNGLLGGIWAYLLYCFFLNNAGPLDPLVMIPLPNFWLKNMISYLTYVYISYLNSVLAEALLSKVNTEIYLRIPLVSPLSAWFLTSPACDNVKVYRKKKKGGDGNPMRDSERERQPMDGPEGKIARGEGWWRDGIGWDQTLAYPYTMQFAQLWVQTSSCGVEAKRFESCLWTQVFGNQELFWFS